MKETEDGVRRRRTIRGSMLEVRVASDQTVIVVRVCPNNNSQIQCCQNNVKRCMHVRNDRSELIAEIRNYILVGLGTRSTT